jgi:DNA-binding transcriptional ArsR family regulator
MMTQVSKQARRTHHAASASPKAAAGRTSALDRRLDTGLFKALADPTRTRLLACLVKCHRACSVSEVAECCSVDFSVVARHLALLAREGVLEAEKRGRTMWYTPRGEDLCARLRALATAIEEWCPCADESCCGGIALPGDADCGRTSGCSAPVSKSDGTDIGQEPDATGGGCDA